MTWRPKNWGNQRVDYLHRNTLLGNSVENRELYEAGADAMHKADIEHIRDNCGLQTLNYHHGEGDWKQWLKDCFNEEKCPFIITKRAGDESQDLCSLMDKPSGRKGICTLITGKDCPEWEEIKRENE